jgi:uncharacterized membrane protein YfcA
MPRPPMEPLVLAGLVLAAFLGGALNAVAGGGTFLTFPLLIVGGAPSREANATSTVALWPGSVASVFGYREELRHGRRTLWVLGTVSAVGGLIGALLLVLTAERTFARLVPWLLLVATAIFAFGPSLSARLHAKGRPDPRAAGALAAMALAQLPIAVYGGYFGAGIGILMLAMMSLFGMEDLDEMNGLKAILGSAINAVALATFAVKGLVAWDAALPMVAGAVAGGYFAARYARRVDKRIVRGLVIATGVVLTAVFFARA